MEQTICIECGEPIRETERPAVHLWDDENREYDFHKDCFERATAAPTEGTEWSY